MCKDNLDQKKARSSFWNWWRGQTADFRRLNNAHSILKGWMAAHEHLKEKPKTPSRFGDLVLLYVDSNGVMGRVPVDSIISGCRLAKETLDLDKNYGIRVSDFEGEGGCERIFCRYQADMGQWTTYDENNKTVAFTV